jgi:iron(II)-dependent oxidoreductase
VVGGRLGFGGPHPPVRSPPIETLPLGGAESLLKARYRALLAETRARTLSLVEKICEEDMDRVHDPLMSPLSWDLGHIAAFEDLWLCQRAGGLEPLRSDLQAVYDAEETPRPRRGDLPYLRCTEVRDFMAAIRERALGVLDGADLSPDGDGLHSRAFVWEMLVQHERQHNETMVQTLQIAGPGVVAPSRRPLPRGAPEAAERTSGNGAAGNSTVRVEDGMVHVGAGPFPLGAAAEGFAYDNERPQHEVDLPAFAIDRLPVTNGDYREFVEDGGYARREWWSEEGWAWKESAGVERPLYWDPDGRVRSFDRIEPLDDALPVMHVSWYEADAYARSRGKRLPTEAEWEKAASWDPDSSVKGRYPWGDEAPTHKHANLDQTGFGPAPAGAYLAGASPYGALGMLGDAWEWTASDFAPYPGFRAFPYREYSESHFGRGHKVLRGASWATRPRVARNTFRNWDFPDRRQIFAGLRCARDA